MAFVLNGFTVANPVGIDVDGTPLMALNITKGGPVPFYLSNSSANNKGIHVIKMTWQFITESEMEVLRLHWQYASLDYVAFVFDDIALAALLSVTDTTAVTVYPGSNLDMAFQQAWAENGDGPILWDVTATFVTQPETIW
jgi:hypothetical protein